MSKSEKVSVRPEETADSGNEMRSRSYYNVGNRREMLAEVRQAIAGSVPVIVVSGEKGVGKSAFCRMAMGEIPDACIPVYFSNTVESFENVVRSIGTRVGCQSIDVSRAGMASTIDAIGECLKSQQKRVVTVFDGAEMIYLATLERIRKMLDQMNGSEVLMQVVFCGRPLLLDNLHQLSICNFAEVPEKRCMLGPLEPDDTAAFLDFLARHHSAESKGAILPEAVRQIHQATGGNAGKIYACAVEIFKSDDPDAALAEVVSSAGGAKKDIFSGKVEKILSLLDPKKYSTKQLGAAAGAAVCLVLLMFIFGGDDPEEVKPPATEQGVTQHPEKAGKVQQGVAKEAGGGKVEQQVARDVAQEEHKTVIKIAGEEPELQKEHGLEEDSSVEIAEVKPQEEAAEQKSGLAPIAQEREGEAGERNAQARTAEAEVTARRQEPEMNEAAEIQQGAAESSLPEREPVHTAADQTLDAEAEAEVAGMEEIQAEPHDTEMGTGVFAIDTTTVEKKVEGGEPLGTEKPEALKRPAGGRGDEQIATMDVMPGGESGAGLAKKQGGETAAVSGGELEGDEGISVPLLRSEKKKLLLPEDSPPVEESNIVISSLSESEEREIPIIRKTAVKKMIIVAEDETVGLIEARKTKIQIPVVGAAIVPDFPGSDAVSTIDSRALMAERLAAGRSWLTGAKNDRYTIQLMVLGAADAEEKMGKILSDRRYSQAADNFYMFQGGTVSPSFFVFYGEYKSMTEARNARNSIPAFLKDHRPYVLSVRGAMQKVKGS